MLKINLDDTPSGPVKVVPAHEVENLTRMGWRLVFTYQDTMLVPCNETEPDTRSNPNTYSSGLLNVTRHHPATVTWFVLRQDETSALAQMAAELEQQTAARAAEVIEQQKLKKDLEDANKRLTTHQALVKEGETRLTRANEERNTFRDKATKLEGDISKIRAAVGELKLKEILG